MHFQSRLCQLQKRLLRSRFRSPPGNSREGGSQDSKSGVVIEFFDMAAIKAIPTARATHSSAHAPFIFLREVPVGNLDNGEAAKDLGEAFSTYRTSSKSHHAGPATAIDGVKWSKNGQVEIAPARG